MTTSYADLGPPVPEEGMPDQAPLRITRIAELAERNGLNEAIILVDAMAWDPPGPCKMILGCNPHSGDITRAAVCLRPGTGFVAIRLEVLPGNLRDIVKTILLDARPA